MKSKTFLTIALLPFLLGGCAVGPDFQSPEIKAPTEWRVETTEQADSIANTPWWEIFQDENLKNLIKTALAENKDLKIAVSRIAQAREGIALAESNYLPTASYGFGAYATNNHLRAGGNPGKPNMNGFPLAGNLNWELDLWGRVRRMDEAATAQYMAAEQNKNAVVMSLVAEVATAYFNLRMLDEQIKISDETAKTRESAYNIAKSKLDEGIGNKIDARQFEADMLAARATVAEFKRLAAVQENALSVLLGRNPSAIVRNPLPLSETLLPDVPAGIPSKLLQRRPDVIAAEQNVRAANAQIGVAISEYFPRISLTGAIGWVSPSLGNLFNSGNRGEQAGANLAGPLFRGGAIRSGIRLAEAQTQEAVTAYEKVVLNSFREVNDALVSLKDTRDRIQNLKGQTEALREALELLRTRFDKGLDSYLPVLDADRYLFTAELQLAAARTDEFRYAIQLYKALGGGWRTADLKNPLLDDKGNPIPETAEEQPAEQVAGEQPAIDDDPAADAV